MIIPPDFQVDFGSRNLPSDLTVVNAIPSPEFGERVTQDDPWGFANSLEWATSCPPPRHNFTSIPRIRSERAAFDLHYPNIPTGRPGVPVASGAALPPDDQGTAG